MNATITLFDEAFTARHEAVRDRLEKRKDAFQKHFKVNPAEAIKSHAEIVSESQYELAAWDYAASAYVAKIGDRFRNPKEAVEAAIESLVRHVLITATSGQYTSGFYNAVTHADLVGTRAAITELEYLANHPAA
jgi:hypothetical protein